jgi:hypothetical protein
MRLGRIEIDTDAVERTIRPIARTGHIVNRTDFDVR